MPGRRVKVLSENDETPRAASGSETMVSRYGEIYAQWRADPPGFWAKAAEGIDWIRPPKTIFDPEAGVYGRWFPDATLNACFNAVDRHVEAGRGEQAAIYYDSPVTKTKRRISYRELQDEVATLAAALTDLGVGRATASSSTCR